MDLRESRKDGSACEDTIETFFVWDPTEGVD
jgi:hypothetical protein